MQPSPENSDGSGVAVTRLVRLPFEVSEDVEFKDGEDYRVCYGTFEGFREANLTGSLGLGVYRVVVKPRNREEAEASRQQLLALNSGLTAPLQGETPDDLRDQWQFLQVSPGYALQSGRDHPTSST